MLPIFKKKEGSAVGLIIKNRSPDKPEEKQEDSDLASCGREILNAIRSEDPTALAKAIKELAKIADSEPHEEGPHEPHSYDAQNIKAGEA